LDITDQCKIYEKKDNEWVPIGEKSKQEILIETLLEEIQTLKKKVDELEAGRK